MQNYVDRFGRPLASQPEADDFPYDFTLISDKTVNAFALPGGPIFVNTGTVLAADNEAQLAGVLAHEISHVALRHATSQASKANLTEFPAALVAALIGSGSAAAEIGQVGLNLGFSSVLLKCSREAESQADALDAVEDSGGGFRELRRCSDTQPPPRAIAREGAKLRRG